MWKKLLTTAAVGEMLFVLAVEGAVQPGEAALVTEAALRTQDVGPGGLTPLAGAGRKGAKC